MPLESPPGALADLWVESGFAYVARFHEDPERVDVYNVQDPTAPVGPICSTVEPDTSHIEDVVVEGQFLYVACDDMDSDIDGVQVHDLMNLAGPVCNGPSQFVPGIPAAHDLFFYDHSSGSRVLFVATVGPTALRGVHVVSVDDPGNPIPVTFIPYPTPPDSYCIPGPGVPCGPHDVYAQRVGTRDLLVVAGLSDGAYIIDVTMLATPTRLAHFGYSWMTPDLDGDGVAECCDLFGDGECDDTNFDGVVDELDKVFRNVTHDARITPDGQYLWTADEKACGGHVITWSLNDILTLCADADGCPPALGEVTPLGELWLPTPLPVSVHQIRWYDSSFAFLPWYEEGLRVLAIAADSMPALGTADPAISPIEVGFFDSLVPNTDGCIENGFPGAACVTGTRVLNPGLFGDCGVSWDDCYAYIADRGSPDNNEAPPNDQGTAGALIVLRYTGGPTAPQPLRLAKDTLTPGRLIASWGDVPFASTFNLYRGTFPTTGGMLATLGTRPSGMEYDHAVIGPANCDMPGSPGPIVNQFIPGVAGATYYYYLMTSRSPCDAAEDREGNYGQDSFGVNRPVAATTCPP